GEFKPKIRCIMTYLLPFASAPLRTSRNPFLLRIALLFGSLLCTVLAFAQLTPVAQLSKVQLEEECLPEPCPCDDFFTEMSVYYFGEDNVMVEVFADEDATIPITSLAATNSGDLLVVDGTGLSAGRLNPYTYFRVTTAGDDACMTRIFSRCPYNSWPGADEDLRVLGKSFGPFTVFSHTDSGNANECTVADIEQDWKVGGNIVAEPTNTLGTRNDENIVFISNDAARGTILNTGEFGINTLAPGAQLEVDGDAIIQSTLDVNDVARMNSSATATSSADAALIVAGGVGVGDNLEVANGGHFGGDLQVDQNASITQNLDVGANATVGVDAEVGNNLLVQNDAQINRDLTVNNNLAVANNGTISGDLQVGQDAQVSGELNVAADAFLGSNANVGADLMVSDEAFVNNRMAVGTATIPAGYVIAAGGGIIAEEVVVSLQGDWPDYVFLPNYEQPEIRQWQAFIGKNGHLPGMPSAAEMEEDGIVDLGESQRLMLEKIEELTLLLIQQQDQIDALQTQLDNRN
ncbi:MAG: hypothetical protein AAF840_07810, partial [Bacteroidota bacterium]